jgi:aminopeptidase YwaD
MKRINVRQIQQRPPSKNEKEYTCFPANFLHWKLLRIINVFIVSFRSSIKSAFYPTIIGILICETSLEAGPSFDSVIARLSSSVSVDSIYRYINRLQNFGTRYAYSDSCRAAEQYLYNFFSSLNLDSVAFDSFSSGSYTLRNVIGTLRGTLDSDAIIIICAHIDAMSPTPLICAPGAEDNASGVSVVMEAARLLKDIRPAYTIKFIGFSGEDLGLLGSNHLASILSSSCTRIAALLNLDMIAWPGGAFGVKILCDTVSQHLAVIESSAAQFYTTLSPQIIIRTPLPSDNYPFQIRGYQCLANIERNEYDTNGYKCYHLCCDTIGNLSMPLAAEVAKMATATLLMFMDFPAPPAGLVTNVRPGDSSIDIRWDPNKEKDIAGYTLYWGTVSHRYTDSITIGIIDSCRSIIFTRDSVIFAALKAFDSAGNVSGLSCEKICRITSGVIQNCQYYKTANKTLKLRQSRNGIEIEYWIHKPQFVTLSVYDAMGRMLRKIVQGWQSAGNHRIIWNKCTSQERICGNGIVIVKINEYAAVTIISERSN